MQVVLQARRSWNSNFMGCCPTTGDEKFPAQVLQSVHLQLLLICGKLPEPACLQRIRGVECFERGRSCLAARRMGGQHVYRSIILSVPNCDMHRCFYGWLVFLNRDSSILFSSDWVVCLCCILLKRFGALINL